MLDVCSSFILRQFTWKINNISKLVLDSLLDSILSAINSASGNFPSKCKQINLNPVCKSGLAICYTTSLRMLLLKHMFYNKIRWNDFSWANVSPSSLSYGIKKGIPSIDEGQGQSVIRHKGWQWDLAWLLLLPKDKDMRVHVCTHFMPNTFNSTHTLINHSNLVPTLPNKRKRFSQRISWDFEPANLNACPCVLSLPRLR